MNLRVHRETSVVQPFDDMGLPQWTMPIEHPGMQPRSQFEKFPDPTGTGQCRVPNVVVEFDVGR